MNARLVDQDFNELVSVRWHQIPPTGQVDRGIERRMKLRDAMVLVSVALDPVLRESVIIHGQAGSWQFEEIIAAYHLMKNRSK